MTGRGRVRVVARLDRCNKKERISSKRNGMVAGYCSRRVERFWGVFGRLVQFRETEVASHQRQLINVVTATLTKSSVIFVLIVILYFLIIFFGASSFLWSLLRCCGGGNT